MMRHGPGTMMSWVKRDVLLLTLGGKQVMGVVRDVVNGWVVNTMCGRVVGCGKYIIECAIYRNRRHHDYTAT